MHFEWGLGVSSGYIQVLLLHRTRRKSMANYFRLRHAPLQRQGLSKNLVELSIGVL